MVAASSPSRSATASCNGARWVGFQTQPRSPRRRARSASASRRTRRQIERIERERRTVSPFADPRNPATSAGAGWARATRCCRRSARAARDRPERSAAVLLQDDDRRAGERRRPPRRSRTRTGCWPGRFDLAFVLIYLYPLLILALTYNLLSAEKEQGTLALALSQPVSLRTLVSARWRCAAVVLLGVVVRARRACAAGRRRRLDAPGAVPRLLLWLGGGRDLRRCSGSRSPLPSRRSAGRPPPTR